MREELESIQNELNRLQKEIEDARNAGQVLLEDARDIMKRDLKEELKNHKFWIDYNGSVTDIVIATDYELPILYSFHINDDVQIIAQNKGSVIRITDYRIAMDFVDDYKLPVKGFLQQVEICQKFEEIQHLQRQLSELVDVEL